MHRLITIRVSHFNEKARWALDRFDVPYREEPYMPLLHAAPVLLATRGKGHADAVSTRLSTPVLVTDEGQVLCDSKHIVAWVSDRYATPETTLYPTDEAAALERQFGEGLGPDTRRIAYLHGLPDADFLERAARSNVGPAQARLFIAARKPIAAVLARALRVTPRGGERSLARVRALYADISARIEGRRHLVGDRFSAADLAFAALSAPVLLPSQEEGFGAVLPTLDEAPEGWARVARELRDTAAGDYALRMFREERGRRQVSLDL